MYLDTDPDHDPHRIGGLSLDRIWIDCIYTDCNPDQDPDKWSCVNRALDYILQEMFFEQSWIVGTIMYEYNCMVGGGHIATGS